MTRLHVDLHTHSHYSRDSVMSPPVFVEACARKGITCVAVTDHNAVAGAAAVERAARAKDAPLRVITGEEVKTAEGEIIGLFLNELVPRGLSPEETIRAIHEQGGVAIVPHPYDAFRRSVITSAALERVSGLVDAIEGYNCRNILGRHDAKARRLALAAGAALEIGGVHVEMDDFETPREFLQSLAGGTVVFHRSLPMVHWISTYAKVRWRLGLRPSYAAP